MKTKLSIVAAAVLGVASINANAATAYRVKDLGALPGSGSFSLAYSISNNGLVSGQSRGSMPVNGADDVTGSTSAVRFHTNGYVQDLGSLGGTPGGHGVTAYGRAINNNGKVAGYSTISTPDGSRVYNAFVNDYALGHMKNIGTLGNGRDSRAYGINNNGMVVGWSDTTADGSKQSAFVYDSNTGEMKALEGPMLGGNRSFAFDINDNGQIAGTATTGDGSGHAFIYENGIAKDLGSLDDTGISEARAINEKGYVTGWSLTDTNDYHAFLYDGTEMIDLGSLGGDTKGWDVNIHGQVVGSGTDADGNNISFLYSDGEMMNLIDLLSPEEQATVKEFREAVSINDDGTIVGRASFLTEDGNSITRAFQLSAVPVPGAIFLMGPAVAFLGFMGKRRAQAAQVA